MAPLDLGTDPSSTLQAVDMPENTDPVGASYALAACLLELGDEPEALRVIESALRTASDKGIIDSSSATLLQVRVSLRVRPLMAGWCSGGSQWLCIRNSFIQ